MLEGQQGRRGHGDTAAFRRVTSLEKKGGLSRIIVAVTDGYVAWEKEVFDLIRIS